jgi:hypothetical protein
MSCLVHCFRVDPTAIPIDDGENSYVATNIYRTACLAALLAIVGSVYAPVSAQQQRQPVVVPPTPGAPAPSGLSAELQRCYGAAQRQLRKHHLYAEFRLGDDLDGTIEEGRRKFTPRVPQDVDRVVKLPAEVLLKKTKDWVDAQLLCGYNGGRYVGADVVELKRR